MSAEPAIRWC